MMRTNLITRALLATGLALANQPALAQAPEPRPAFTPVPAHQGGCEAGGRLDPDAPPWTPTEAPLVLLITFDANVTNAQRAVINQAAADWLALIEDDGTLVNPYPLHFLNGPLTGNTLARANTFWNSGGTLLRADITIDNDGTSVFFVDPTPGDSSEFDSSGNCIDTTCDETDLLSVMRHEIGHALGWTGFYSNPPNPLVSGHVFGTTYDPGRLNIAMDPVPTDHPSASEYPGDLMIPLINAGTRRDISLYPDLATIARGYNHSVALRFVDSNVSGTQLGSADFPWKTFATADSLAPSGMVILVIPGTYNEANPLVLDASHRYLMARGTSAVVQ